VRRRRPARPSVPPILERPPTRLDIVQRRVRRLAPAPIAEADLRLFRWAARTQWPVIGLVLPRLSRSANKSRLWLGLAAILALTGGRSGRRAALRGVLAIAATSAVTNLPAKLLTGRARPDVTLVPDVRRLARVPTSTSFPSGHAASAAAFATGVALERPQAAVPIAVLAAGVGVSRVYTGVHFPGDVLVGAAIGAGVGAATTRVWPLDRHPPATGASDDGAPPRVGTDGSGLVLVANAGAGTRLGPGPAEHVRTSLPSFRLFEAEEGEHLPALLRRAAADARVLGVAGGDGSASTAARVAIEHDLPLAVVPAGTLNHLAKDLGVESVDATVRAVHEQRTIRMDVAEIDGRIFVNAASVGAYPHLVAERERLERRIGKWPAALWCTLVILVGGRPVELDLDGVPRRLWLLTFGNCTFRADGIAPHGRDRVDDGLLDVRIVDAEVPWARTRVLASVLTGRRGRCAAYERWTATEVEVASREGPLRLATDGETWMGSEAFQVTKQPRALTVLQPTPDPR
jgi:diacylglycerol kinase family enzyme/membrane-associated phospholipid phosphatase